MAEETEVVTPVGTETQVEKPEFDRSALESKVAAGLNGLNDDEGETAEAETPAAEEVQQEATAEAAVEKKEETPEGEQTPAASASKTQAPTLPDAFRRSLKAYEWTDEEIDANLKAYGPKFIETAAKLHGNRNKEIADWAAAGRQAREQTTTQQQPTAAKKSDGLQLQAVDISALKKKYGDDPLFDELLAPMNKTIEVLNQLAPQLQGSVQKAQQAELETLGRQIEEFFSGKDAETYKELYGTAADLKPENTQNRNKVLELADALISGARLQGRNLTLNEALTMARDSTAGDFKATAARKEIAGKLQERATGISLKPTGRKPAPAGKPNDRSSLEKKVKSGLAAAFA